MNLLLDTHVWIWGRLEPHRLSSEVARALTSTQHEKFLSPVSVWELLILVQRRRVILQESVAGWLAKSVEDMNLIEAPLTWEVCAAMESMQFTHRDPADRFLVATAKAYALTLVTADERLMHVPGIEVLPNR